LAERVNRPFKADRPNQLWVSDFTDVSTWQGWLDVAFDCEWLCKVLYLALPYNVLWYVRSDA
jgi:transposase InsO family protein